MKYLLVCLALFLMPSLAYGDDQSVTVTNAWARPTANTRSPGGVFLNINNTGKASVILTGAHSDIARMAHIHMTKSDGGMMTMDMIDKIDIQSGESLSFAPGGYHIMLMGLAQKLTKGDTFKLTLTFEGSDDVVITVPVTGMTGPN